MEVLCFVVAGVYLENSQKVGLPRDEFSNSGYVELV